MQTDYETILQYNTEIVYVNPMEIHQTKDYFAKSKMSMENTPFTAVLDPEHTFTEAYSIEKPGTKFKEAYPSTFVIDRGGILRFKYIGMTPSDRPSLEHIKEILKVVEGK